MPLTRRSFRLPRLALRAEARLRSNFQESDFVLLLIGNDWRVKGLETVLRAMGALRELPFHVIAAGDDSPDSFRETAKSLGISERCRFEPSREDVLDFYAAADLYVSHPRRFLRFANRGSHGLRPAGHYFHACRRGQ